jgi:hypothetical protein
VRKIKFGISFGLALLSSFSLAERTPSKLGSRSLMRQLASLSSFSLGKARASTALPSLMRQLHKL